MFCQTKRRQKSITAPCVDLLGEIHSERWMTATEAMVKPHEWWATLSCCPVISNTEALMDGESADTLIYNLRPCTCERHPADIRLTQIDSPVVETECIKDPVTCLINLVKCHLLPGPCLCLTPEPQGYVSCCLHLFESLTKLSAVEFHRGAERGHFYFCCFNLYFLI